MGMTIKDVAGILLNRQNNKFSFIVDGLTRQKLGFEGFKFAQERGWVATDDSLQCITLSQRPEKLAEMQAAALATDSPFIELGGQVQPERRGSRMFDLDHVREINAATARLSTADVVTESHFTMPPGWSNFCLPGTKQDGTTNMLHLLDEAEVYKPGDQVIIGEDGEQFFATVQSTQPDGKLVLSFGDKKPSKVKLSYEQAEVAKTEPQSSGPVVNHEAPKLQAQPITPPTPTVTGGPAAPGIGRR